MITYEEALKAVLNNTNKFLPENIFIQNSVGSIIAEDIYSSLDIPAFDKSLMDGYAVNSLDLKNLPAKLKCIGVIQAGESFSRKIKRGECVKIMTGAPLPYGADAVVMVEDTLKDTKTQRHKDTSKIQILKKVRKGENVCFRGEILKRGQRVTQAGTEIFSSNVAMFAAMGRRFVKTIAKPVVAILNTGSEIIAPGVKSGRNKIYNVNGPVLEALLKLDGFEFLSLGIVEDNVRELKEAFKKGLKADVLLVSGGVSMGDYDLVPQVLQDIGVKKIFHKVSIKPGKPLFFGKYTKGADEKSNLVFGLPGSPVSVFLNYLLFIQPVLFKMMGREQYTFKFRDGVVTKQSCFNSERKYFALVKILKKDNQYYLTPVESRGSADIFSLSKADGFMVVNKNKGIIKKYSKQPFITWKKI